MTGVAVVDVETTGLYNSDRVVEIAVVLLDEDLRTEDEWSTLVNPHRDVSARAIHGITASDVSSAPDFAHLACHVAALLDGRVVAGHNASFDMRMLHNCFQAQSRVSMPSRVVGIDTLRLARATLGGPASLEVVCEYLSVEPGRHDALSDARATGLVLSRLLEQTEGVVIGGTEFRNGHGSDLAVSALGPVGLPALIAEARIGDRWEGACLLDPAPTHSRTDAAHARSDRDGYLARLVAQLPASTDLADPNLDEYLLTLEGALLDRMLTPAEADTLAHVATAHHLSSARVMAAHRAFMGILAAAAWADGVVTAKEKADLAKVAALLDVSAQDTASILGAAKATNAMLHPPGVSRWLAPGDRVVFTGEASMPRADLAAKAEMAGLTVTSAVSGRTRIVVMADPLSESTKARKARELGVPVLAESVFVTMCADLAARL